MTQRQKNTSRKTKSSTRSKTRVGGTTGTPAIITQPPAPVISFRIGPTHGVSGYPTTGIPGAYNVGFSTPGTVISNVNPSASRYDIQASGSSVNIQSGVNNFSQSTPAQVNVASSYSAFTSEPMWEQRLGGRASAQTASLARNQQLQASGRARHSSFLNQRAYHGVFGEDLYMQSQLPVIDEGQSFNRAVGDIPTPVRPVNLFGATPSTSVRHGDQQTGTVNDPSRINTTGPIGQSNLHNINDHHTPQVATAGYATPGTHPAHGPSPSPVYDGSWTLDVLPPQQLPGLLNLPPAADIPVQTYSGYGPQSTSIHATRPLWGQKNGIQTRTVAVVS